MDQMMRILFTAIKVGPGAWSGVSAWVAPAP